MDMQMARLQESCALGPEEQDKLPPIWGKMQAVQDKEVMRCVLQALQTPPLDAEGASEHQLL